MFSSGTIILDCGASRTALGVFSCKGGRLRLDDHAVEPFPAGAGGGDDWLEQTQAALLALRDKVKSTGPVVLVLPAHRVLTKHIRTPKVEAARRDRIIRFEAEQNIPCALADVTWDSVVVGEYDLGLEVLLAAARLEMIERLFAVIRATGFELRAILPSPLATLAGFRLAQSAPREPVLVLNLGVCSTTLLLVNARRFVVRTIMPGGQNHPAGHGVESLAVRLAREITRSVLYYRHQHGMEAPGRIYLTGGEGGPAALDEALAAKVKVPVDRFEALGAIECADAVTRDAAALQGATDMIGAAAIQLLPAQPAMNLLPPRFRQVERFRRRQPWLIAATMLAMAAFIPPLVHFHQLANEARRKTTAIEGELAVLRGRDARIRANLQQLADLGRQITRLRSVYDRKAGWLGLLADLQDRLVRVEDAWLEKLQVRSSPGAPLKLAVSGCILDKANPLAKGSPEVFERIKTLLSAIAGSPFVASVEGERFDPSRPGVLKFDFVLVADPHRPL